MMRISVLTRQGQGLMSALMADFGANGGAIGRATTNTLVLEDPERTVSRVHAQVVVRDGNYFIIDRGSNPTMLNATLLGAGHEAQIKDGDTLTIGSFVLAVENISDQAPQPPILREIVASSASEVDSSNDVVDPFDNLMDGLLPSPMVQNQAQPPQKPQNNGDSSLAPDLFEVSFSLPNPAKKDPINPRDVEPMTGFAPVNSRHGTPSIDSLFGNICPGGDPLALSPLADPLSQPNTSGADDPLQALGQSNQRAIAPPRSDHLPIGQFGFVPPQVHTEDPLPLRAVQPNQSLLLEEPLDEKIQSDVRAQAKATAIAFGSVAPESNPLLAPSLSTPFAASSANSHAGSIAPSAPTPPTPSFAKAPHQASPGSETSSPLEPQRSASGQSVQYQGGDLLKALLKGLNQSDGPPHELTPEVMERIGVILRTSIAGTLQLLQARQELKNELRAERTMIVKQGNNPLKFSPSEEVAISHLLGPTVRGFLPAEEAIVDAFEDLRAHQFGLLVSLRATLEMTIGRFAPTELEKKFTDQSALSNLFSNNRKAKLWDKFVSLYAQIASETQQDCQTHFNQTFRQAYEEQMQRFKQSHKA